MSPVRNQLVGVIDCLPEQEQILLLEIARRFIPDDVAMPDDIAAHEAAMRDYAAGETVRHEDIDWG